MNNNLCKIEKDLRSIAKRCKTVKYSIGLDDGGGCIFTRNK